MSRVLGEAFVRVRPDLTRFGSETERGMAPAGEKAGARWATEFESSTKSRVSSTVKRLAITAGAAFSVRAVAGGLREVNATASDAQQSVGASEQIFKRFADTVVARSNRAAGAVGLSANEYRELANVTGAMLKSSGAPLRQVTDLTDKLNVRAADLAATFGGSTKEAIEAVSSLLRGEADPIERYGVSIKQSDVKARLAAQGLDKLKGSQAKQAEMQARLSLLFEQTADAQGQSRRESDQWAGVSQRASARAEDLKAKVGNGLLPVFAAGGKVVADRLLPALSDLADKYLPIISKRGVELANNIDLEGVFGGIEKTLGGIDWGKAGKGMGDIGGSLKEVVDAAGRGGMDTFNAGLEVTKVVLKFAADNADLLAKALPYLAAGFVLTRTAQAAANSASIISIPLRILEASTTLAHSRALRTHAAAMRGSNGAAVTNNAITATSTKLTMRQRIATLASAAATKVKAAAMRVLNLVMKANPLGLLVVGLLAAGAALVYAYKKSDTFREVVQRAWAVVKGAVVGAWRNHIKPALQQLWQFIQERAIPAIRHLWTHGVKPAFAAIGRFIGATWRGVIKPLFFAFATYLTKVVFPVLRFLWNRVIKPVFSGIGRTISWTWNRVIRPVFTALKDFISTKVQPAFRRGVDAIGRIWGGLRRAASAPVRFVVDTVYNKGIRKVINAIPGVKDLPPARLAFRNGGVMPGYTPGRDVHRFFSATGGQLDLSGGEAFMRPEWTRHVGRSGVALLNAAARRGRRALEHAMAAVSGASQHGAPRRRYFLGGIMPLQAGTLTNDHGRGYYGASFAGDLNGPLDLARPPALVKAWKAGVVAATNYWNHSYGHHVNVDHGGGQWSRYAHLSSISTTVGQRLRSGQALGRVGSTGNSTGAHLHFEVRGGKVEGSTGGGGGGGAIAKFGAAIGAAKDLATSVPKWLSKLGGMPGWGKLMRTAASRVLGSAREWINDKVPGPGPVPAFDRGGVARGVGTIHKRTIRPERVLSPDQTEAFERYLGGGPGNPPAADIVAALVVALQALRLRLVVGGNEFDAYVDAKADGRIQAADNRGRQHGLTGAH